LVAAAFITPVEVPIEMELVQFEHPNPTGLVLRPLAHQAMAF